MKGAAAVFEQMWRSSEKECEELRAEIEQLRANSQAQQEAVFAIIAAGERLQAKIDLAIEIYGQQFDSPWERARQMWQALKQTRKG